MKCEGICDPITGTVMLFCCYPRLLGVFSTRKYGRRVFGSFLRVGKKPFWDCRVKITALALGKRIVYRTLNHSVLWLWARSLLVDVVSCYYVSLVCVYLGGMSQARMWRSKVLGFRLIIKVFTMNHLTLWGRTSWRTKLCLAGRVTDPAWSFILVF